MSNREPMRTPARHTDLPGNNDNAYVVRNRTELNVMPRTKLDTLAERHGIKNPTHYTKRELVATLYVRLIRAGKVKHP